MPEIEFWQSIILCSVLEANPPFEVMQGYLNRIWENYEVERVIQVRKGVFLVRFANLQDKMAVKNRGIYYFDSKPLLVKGWNPQMDLNTDEIKSLPLWAQFPNLDIKYWGLESLSKIESLLGILIKTDRCTKEKLMINYAQLMIKMPLEGPFPEHIEFFNDNDVLVR